MTFHTFLRPAAVGICLLAATAATAADKPAALTPQEVADGWVLLFDGETLFGLEANGKVELKSGKLTFTGAQKVTVGTEAELGPGTLSLQYACTGPNGGAVGWYDEVRALEPGKKGTIEWSLKKAGTSQPWIEVGPGTPVTIERFAYRPAGLTPLFNGKDLTGWKVFAGDPKRAVSKFEVTPAGELSVKNGPGDLQTEKQFDDFLLQLECKSNGTALNSGVFFRCLPDQYQQGYEAQIQNAYLGGDRTKPVDFGTGAVYRRVKARKVVSDDKEWFTMTVLARGPHISTWVNGYPVVSWTDDRPPAANARQGLYTQKGAISLQGHDPTTDLLFRNIRVAEMK